MIISKLADEGKNIFENEKFQNSQAFTQYKNLVELYKNKNYNI